VRDILDEIRQWQESGLTFALATVVDTAQSAPRGLGAAVAVRPDGTVVGSVSGGCVEGAVVESCRQVLAGAAPQLSTYGYTDDEAFAVGPTCGGSITVFVQAVRPDGSLPLDWVHRAVQENRSVAIATLVEGSSASVGASLVVSEDGQWSRKELSPLERAVRDDALGMLAQGLSGMRRYGEAGERLRGDVGVFFEILSPAARMLVFGAVDFAAAVAKIGKFLGYRVTVCDARAVFATAKRFPHADEVVVDRPQRYLADAHVDERTVICVLTHDAKFDVPVIREALRTPAGYIGVMGSRRTHDKRIQRLLAAGSPKWSWLGCVRPSAWTWEGELQRRRRSRSRLRSSGTDGAEAVGRCRIQLGGYMSRASRRRYVVDSVVA
jgi:xanthine dehydrogenase accessory factor